jgi:hypothetical protein
MAWTTPRDWTAGELVTEAIMDTHVRDNMNALTRFVGKTADESVVSSTTLQNDDHLFFAMGTNEAWFVSGVLWHECANSGVDIRIGFTIPAGGDYHIVGHGLSLAGASHDPPINFRSISDTSAFFSGSTGNAMSFYGVVQTAGTAGNFQLQFAQNVSNAAGIILKKGSAMMFQKVA